MLFQFQRSSFGSLLHLWSILQNVFNYPYVTLMNLWLTVNLNYYELGLITSISTRLGIKDFRRKYGQPRLSPTTFCAALKIAFRVELCHK